jgi:glycosyltransferase involved in cell wall biosynthesis
LRVSVVVPVYNGAATLADCLGGLENQNVERSAYEVIVVDDGSSDDSASIAAERGAVLVQQANAGAAAARNAGLAASRGEWVAFTDADCVPSRGWLRALLRAAEDPAGDVICVAGKTVGLASVTPAARFVDLSGAFDAARHLSHPRWPFAPSGNVLYRREVLRTAGGYDPRFRSYEACELHQRLAAVSGRCVYEAGALVFHRHRATWHDYWRQQRSYGGGLAQFMRAHHAELSWSAVDELRAWWRLGGELLRASLPAGPEVGLHRRGTFVKSFAQRVGFVAVYWGRPAR